MPNNDESIMKEGDLIFSRNSNNEITGGGFCINSYFLKNMHENGVTSPIATMNIFGGNHKLEKHEDEDDGDDKNHEKNKSKNIINFNSDINFNTIVVPLGLFYKKEKMVNSSLAKLKKENDVEDDNDISDEIYDELLNMVTVKDEMNKNVRNNKKNQTAKNKSKKIIKNKTAKNM
jgi:hypothetical protein